MAKDFGGSAPPVASQCRRDKVVRTGQATRMGCLGRRHRNGVNAVKARNPSATSESITLIIPGKPIVKGRPRFGQNEVYTPRTTAIAEETLAWHLRRVCPIPLLGSLGLVVRFYFRYPQSWSKAKRKAVDEGAEPWHTGRPDLDNLLKLVTDAGNGILWRDDAQVVKIEAVKVYSAEDQTMIKVFSVEEQNFS